MVGGLFYLNARSKREKGILSQFLLISQSTISNNLALTAGGLVFWNPITNVDYDKISATYSEPFNFTNPSISNDNAQYYGSFAATPAAY